MTIVTYTGGGIPRSHTSYETENPLMKRPIGEPSAATWTIDDLFVKISAKEQVRIGSRYGGSVDLDPQEASKLTDMIENALRWLDRRIAQEDATPANVPHEHGKAF